MELLKLAASSDLVIQQKIEPIRFKNIVEGGATENDLEDLIVKYPSLLNLGTYDADVELLIIARQPRTATKKRADLFAIDQDGILVVIEIKRDAEDEKARTEGMEFQGIRYAASSRRMTCEDVIEMFANYIRKTEGDKADSLNIHRATAIDRLGAHLGDEGEVFTEEDLIEHIVPREGQRICLVAADFEPEVTAACAWLREHDINISCFRLQPFKIGDTTCLNRERLIPPPELDEFYIDMAKPSDSPVESPGAKKKKKKKSDKPVGLVWEDGSDEIPVKTWKEALTTSIRYLLSSGLGVHNLPMKSSVDGKELMAASEIREGLFIDVNASAEQMRSWLNKAVHAMPQQENAPSFEFLLKIVTQSGKEYLFPE